MFFQNKKHNKRMFFLPIKKHRKPMSIKDLINTFIHFFKDNTPKSYSKGLKKTPIIVLYKRGGKITPYSSRRKYDLY